MLSVPPLTGVPSELVFWSVPSPGPCASPADVLGEPLVSLGDGLVSVDVGELLAEPVPVVVVDPPEDEELHADIVSKAATTAATDRLVRFIASTSAPHVVQDERE
jgi:hypothetical protein